jgi:lysophospholipase L1-like esterase
LKTIPLYPHLERRIIDACKANLKEIVAKARNQDIIVILTTVFPLGELPLERRLFWSDAVAEAIIEVNDYIPTLADEDVLIFDAAALLSDQSNQVKAEYQTDFLHLNNLGYLVLNEGLQRFLLEINQRK